MSDFESAMFAWLALNTVAQLVGWARLETRLGHCIESLRRLWTSHDELHPRRANPGSRDHDGHNHEEE